MPVHWFELGLFFLYTSMVAILLLGAFRLRHRLGFSPLYVAIGVLQYFQTILVATVYFEIMPRIFVSPGSAILFSGAIAAVLLVYLKEDASEARKLVYSLLFANVLVALIQLTMGFSLQFPGLKSQLQIPRVILVESPEILLWGTLALLLDCAILILLFERFASWFRQYVLLKIFLTLASVLLFDSMVFVYLAFGDQADFFVLWRDNAVGKMFAVPIYTLFLYSYFRWTATTPPATTDQDFNDFFKYLSFREKFELASHQRDQIGKKNAALTSLNEKLRETQLELIHSNRVASVVQLIAGVAHEINNPLTIITGNTALLKAVLEDISQMKDKFPDADTCNRIIDELTISLAAVERGSARIDGVVSTLRFFGRSSSQVSNAANLNENLETTIKILRGATPSMTVTTSFGHLPPIECSESLLNQVFFNIMLNGVEAAERNHKTPWLSVTTTLTDDAGSQRILILIEDGAGGIEESIKPKIFDPFFTTKPVGGGLGLGLTMAYRIVQMHGGSLRLESTPIGTRVGIELKTKLDPENRNQLSQVPERPA